jgi:protein TonB
MKREFVISLIFHVVLVSAAIVSSPFEPKSKIDYGATIVHVSLPSPSQIPQIKPETPAPIQIPRALAAVDPDIPIDAPTTKPAVKIEKPKTTEKPKTKPKPKTPPPPANTAKGENSQEGTEEGKVDASATSSGGASLSGATVDNSSFTYGWWFDLAFKEIAGNFRFSYSYDGSLICVVYFQVIQSGRVLNLEVKQSSGVPEYDRACLLAVEKSAPLPPLPRDFTQEIIGITLPFTK